MSKVEMALKKVKGLSNSQAEELLRWLAARKDAAAARKPQQRNGAVKRGRRPAMRQIMSWYASVRGTTDWDPPHMPPDLVTRASL